MTALKQEEQENISLVAAFWNAHNGETLNASEPYVRFVFDHGFSPLTAGRNLNSALYAHAGFPSLAPNDDFDEMRVVGYGQTDEGDEYVDLNFSDDPENNNFIDGLTDSRFLASFMAVGVKQLETSDGRLFGLENVKFNVKITEIKPKKQKLG